MHPRHEYNLAWGRANRERRAATDAKWRQENPGALRAAKQRWRKANRATLNELDARRKAVRVSQRCSCCSDEQLREIYEVAHFVEYEVDHRVPLALGGPHCKHNLQILSPQAHRCKTTADRAVIKASGRK